MKVSRTRCPPVPNYPPDRGAGAACNRRAPRHHADRFEEISALWPKIDLPDRTWPSKAIETAPIWCSVDLRDGNQALVDPMGHDRKARFFALLKAMNFKEIEIGFPSASQTDFDFARWCIEEGGTPDDVSLQVLVQCRPELITRTFESLEGAVRPIVHFYNSTKRTPAPCRLPEGSCRHSGEIATDAAKMVMDMAAKAGAKGEDSYRFEYSPESFTGTELDFAVEICNAVAEIVRPTPDNKLISQPAGHGRDVDAKHPCRPDRMHVPQSRQSREPDRLAASAQRPRHGRSRRPSSA